MPVRIAAVFVATLLAALPLAAEARTPTRWAVVIGIGDYQLFGDEVGGDLQGTINDALGIHDALITRWGFRPDRVRLLLDEEASRDAIRLALTKWLPDVVAPGDVVVIYFAGHGSQAWDDDGDEADGLDETIAPWDVLPGSTDNDITDDDLRVWLDRFAAQHVVVILDSCHSGTATRAFTPYGRPRLLNRTLPARDRASPSRAASRGAGVQTETEGLELLGDHVLEIAASRADQAAMDVAWPVADGAGTEWGGAFTTFLVRGLRQSPAETTYEALFNSAVQQLKQAGFAQDPLITLRPALRHATLFSGEGDGSVPPPSPAAIAVVGHGGGTGVEIGGGLAAGLRVGMLVTIDDGLFRVTRVSADRAVVTAADSANRTLPRHGSIARITALPVPVVSLRVSLQALGSGDGEVLRSAIAAIAEITSVTDVASVPDILVRRSASGYELTGRDGAVRATIGIGDIVGLRGALDRELTARRLGALDNPSRPFSLELLATGGATPLRLGDPIEFRVRSGRGGFLTVIDFAPDGSTSILFPNEIDAEHRIPPDQWVSLPTRAMRDAGVFFEAQEPVGEGMVRAFVTPEPLDLPLAANGRVDPADIAGGLEASAGTIQDRGSTLLRADTWAAAAVHYEIRR